MGNFRGFYSRNGKSRKQSIPAGWAHRWPSSNRRKTERIKKHNPWPVRLWHRDASKQPQNGGLGQNHPPL